MTQILLTSTTARALNLEVDLAAIAAGRLTAVQHAGEWLVLLPVAEHPALRELVQRAEAESRARKLDLREQNRLRTVADGQRRRVEQERERAELEQARRARLAEERRQREQEQAASAEENARLSRERHERKERERAQQAARELDAIDAARGSK